MVKDRLFTLRLDPETYAKLEKIAKRGDRPVNVAYIIRQAIAEFLKKEKQ